GAAHFLRERRILARLEHPGITRLIDGGVGEHGQPWFAMEYVEGQSLPDYCHSHGLGLEARLCLFTAICDAVAYAHRQLVVHCDLKPDNILVDGNGQPRLLDFGIAHLLRGNAADAATTQLLGRRLTPGYAAPEQLAGEPVGVTTDVYALGVLLYELLTGVRPYGGRDATPAAAVHAQSTGAAPAPSRARAAQPPVPRKRLRGDLDLIVASALRHAPAQRYASVDALAADLRRHLSGLPLRAHAPSRRYRALRYVQRHRVGLALAALVVLTCAAGLVGIVHEAALARAQAQRATAVKDFLIAIFNDADPDRHPGKEVSARELLEAAAKRLQHDTRTPAPIAAEMADTLSQNFGAIGANSQAAAAAKHALALHEQVSGKHSPAAARARIRDAQWLYLLSQDKQAQSQLHMALDDLGDDVSTDTVHAHLILADLAHQHDHPDTQMREVRQAVALAQRLPADKAYWRGSAQYSFAMALMAHGKFKSSADALARATQQFRGVQSLAAARKAQYMHAVLLMHTHDPQQAQDLLADLVKRERATLGDNHPQVAQALQIQAEALMLLDRDIDARRLALESVAVAARSGEPDNTHAQLLRGNALIILNQGDLATTRKLVVQAQALLKSAAHGILKPAAAMPLLGLRALRGEPGAVASLRTIYDGLAAHSINAQELDKVTTIVGHGYLAVGELEQARAWCQQAARAASSPHPTDKYAMNALQLSTLQALLALQAGDV
ncbi:MAG: serine/threonine protein kinase, partial [Xanthomonadales bacterium]|nr:serine/threonine protein kinase [Xanthomonadales bacterium]